VVTRPYLGIDADARLYAVQALANLSPSRFGQDLYLQFGSQDQFTLFTKIFQPFIAVFGLSWGARLLGILGQGLWVSGLIFLAWNLFRQQKLVIGAVAAAIATPVALQFVRVGDSFLTPRLFSEALTMLALGFMLRGSTFSALVTLCVSMLLHPLMTIPGFLVLFFYKAMQKRWWWLVVLFLMSVVYALGTLNVSPFDRLFISLDPDWRSVVEVRDYFSFITHWTLWNWLQLGSLCLLLIFAFSFAVHPTRQLLLAALFACVTGLIVTYLGADLANNALISALQPWRAFWILGIFSVLVIGAAWGRMFGDPSSRITDAWLLLTAGLGLLAGSVVVPELFLAAMPLLGLGCFFQVLGSPDGNSFHIQAKILTRVAILLVCVFAVWAHLRYIQSAGFDGQTFIHRSISITLCILTLSTIANLLKSRIQPTRSGGRPIVSLLLSTAFLVIATLNWDQRSSWTKFVESADPDRSGLSNLIPSEGALYWEGDVRIPWIYLKRGNYFSCEQAAGAIFNRDTALEYKRRSESFLKLATMDFDKFFYCPGPVDSVSGRASVSALRAVCQAERNLSTLVLTQPVPDAAASVWRSPVTFRDTRFVKGAWVSFSIDNFYIYFCRDYR
jgi:hypothetical protein